MRRQLVLALTCVAAVLATAGLTAAPPEAKLACS